MKLKKVVFGFLILTLLSCNYVTQMIVPPTATPFPAATATATITPSPTATPLIPAYIPPECASSPLATIAPDTIAQATPEVEANEEIPKSKQLRVLRELGNVVEDVYVYPDFNGKDWNEIESRYKSKIEAGINTETFYTEMQKMIRELGDEHSFFLSPLEVEASEAELKGDTQFVGIGVYGDVDQDGHMTVISVFPDSTAAQAGIKSHDTILTADGTPVFEGDINHIRGPECSAVTLSFQSPGTEPRQAILVRQTIKGGFSIDTRLIATTDGSKIGYIFIPTFFDETIPPQIEDALNEFGQLDGLVLDVRMNGGGSSTVANPILSFFTSGKLGQFVSRDSSRPMGVEADPVQNSQTVPLVVMVNEDTVSYGEIFAGIMRDSRGAKITGETSLGNVELLHGFDFDDGSQVWLASERFFPAHSDENWEETGIVPDVQAYADWNTITNPNDIKTHLMKWSMREWELDHSQASHEHWTVEWMNVLPKMDFKLEV